MIPQGKGGEVGVGEWVRVVWKQWRQVAILLTSNWDVGNIRTFMYAGAIGIHRWNTHWGECGLI